MPSPATEQQLAVADKIRLLLAEASAARIVVRAAEHGERLAEAYPLCGMSAGEIAALIVKVAAAAQVAVELPKPPSRPPGE